MQILFKSIAASVHCKAKPTLVAANVGNSVPLPKDHYRGQCICGSVSLNHQIYSNTPVSLPESQCFEDTFHANDAGNKQRLSGRVLKDIQLFYYSGTCSEVARGGSLRMVAPHSQADG